MEIKAKQKYRHFKGAIMEIICIGKDSETLEELVVYKHLEDGQIWIRPKKMFEDNEDISNRTDNVTGQTTRFELIEE